MKQKCLGILFSARLMCVKIITKADAHTSIRITENKGCEGTSHQLNNLTVIKNIIKQSEIFVYCLLA